MQLKHLISVSLLFLLVIGCSGNDDFDREKYKSELEKHAQSYMSELKSVLVANMKEGGPYQAVNVCSDTAALLTQEFSQKMDVDIKRFSFKNRNVHNFPDPFEIEIMRDFEEKYQKNELTNESFIIVKNDKDGKEAVTYAKPIFIEAPCLNCHGEKNMISADVKEVLSQKYPSDKANGYKIGDLRGAISVTKIY